MNTVQKAQFILDQHDTPLGKLLAQARQIEKLDVLTKQFLNPNLAKHCQVCNLKNGRLIIATAKAVYATRLKYEIPELLAKLRQLDGFQQLTGIDCKVMPALEETSALNPKIVE